MLTLRADYRWDEWVVPEVEPFRDVLGQEAAERISQIVHVHLQAAFEDITRATEWDSINGQLIVGMAAGNVFGDDLPISLSITPAEFEVAIKRDFDRDLNETNNEKLCHIRYSLKKWQAAIDRCRDALEQAVREK